MIRERKGLSEPLESLQAKAKLWDPGNTVSLTMEIFFFFFLNVLSSLLNMLCANGLRLQGWPCSLCFPILLTLCPLASVGFGPVGRTFRRQVGRRVTEGYNSCQVTSPHSCCPCRVPPAPLEPAVASAHPPTLAPTLAPSPGARPIPWQINSAEIS